MSSRGRRLSLLLRRRCGTAPAQEQSVGARESELLGDDAAVVHLGSTASEPSMVTVLSLVGSVIARVVSCASAVAPSKVSPAAVSRSTTPVASGKPQRRTLLRRAGDCSVRGRIRHRERELIAIVCRSFENERVGAGKDQLLRDGAAVVQEHGA